MTELETRIDSLLRECERVLPYVDPWRDRWLEREANSAQKCKVRDDRSALERAYFASLERLANSAEYKAARKAFASDPYLAKAPKAAGYSGGFDQVLLHTIQESGRLRRRRVTIDTAAALEEVRRLRTDLGRPTLRYQARVRLLGVRLTSKELALPDDLVLQRLTRRERNARQPNIDEVPWAPPHLVHHPTEACWAIKVPIDHSQEGCFFNSLNEARRRATGRFSDLLQALRLSTPGYMGLGPMVLSGGWPPMRAPVVFPSGAPSVNVTLRPRDKDRLVMALDLLAGGPSSDPQLTTSLRRFRLV